MTSGDYYGLKVPPAEASLRAARLRLAQILRRDELVWVVAETYNSAASSWNLDIMRTGSGGRWMRQRYRYDGQAEVLYFLGESALNETQFRAYRSSATLFPIADLQDQPAE